MRPLAALPEAARANVRGVLADIDDTITTGGRLTPEAYAALARLHHAGLVVVPITGRPAGWCDHIARMWPVEAVIGENGAFVYTYDRHRRKMRRDMLLADGDPAARREALMRVAARVLREVPGAALAADQPFRISDVAVDYCEDVPRLGAEKVDEICRILEDEGVHFKVSSIHVNFWIGDFDKLSGVRSFAERQEGISFTALAAAALFIGDSPNDEPLFGGFAHSIAVGNIRGFLGRLRQLPEFITEKDSAEGFTEAVRTILAKRSGGGASDIG
jgi:HAD superfamily hydrolase (TIGR01484 family)